MSQQGVIERIPLVNILFSKTNPRQTLDSEADRELLESIKASGVLEKILVRPFGASNRYELVDGARRTRAAAVAGIGEILAEVREMTDTEVVEYQLLSFLQRQGLHPLDESKAYVRLQKEYQLDHAGIAQKVGKTRQYVRERLELASTIQPVSQALSAGKISLDHALLIAKLQPDAQAKALKACLSQYDPLTVGGLRDWIEEEVRLDLESAPFPTDDKDLLPKAGPCTTCPKRSANNPDLFGEKKNTC